MHALPQEIDKYLRHVEEIDKITSLLLGLSGRLARADNALLLLSDQDGQELRVSEERSLAALVHL